MSDRGALETFEITWSSGHVEAIQAHQVTWPGNTFGESHRPQLIVFHGEFDGQWTLVLSALEADIVRVRNVTRTEESIDPNGGAR
jgi:hypothetical protein